MPVKYINVHETTNDTKANFCNEMKVGEVTQDIQNENLKDAQLE